MKPLLFIELHLTKVSSICIEKCFNEGYCIYSEKDLSETFFRSDIIYLIELFSYGTVEK